MIEVVVGEEIVAHPRDPAIVKSIHRKARVRQQLVKGTLPFQTLTLFSSSFSHLFLILLLVFLLLWLRRCAALLEQCLPLQYRLCVPLPHHQNAHFFTGRGGGCNILGIFAARGSTSGAGWTVPAAAAALLARIQVGGDLGLLARRLAVNIVGCHLQMKGHIQSDHILVLLASGIYRYSTSSLLILTEKEN